MFVECPNCGVKNQIKHDLLGKPSTCRKCNIIFTAKSDTNTSDSDVPSFSNVSIGEKPISTHKITVVDFLLLPWLIISTLVVCLFAVPDMREGVIALILSVILGIPLLIMAIKYGFKIIAEALVPSFFITSALVFILVIPIWIITTISDYFKGGTARPTNQSAIKKTDWEEHGLKGKVKERITSDINVYRKFGKDVIRKFVDKYDSNGIWIEGESYNEEGSITKSIPKYDGNGKCIEMASYDANEILTQKKKYKYDGNGNEIEMTSYNTNETLTKKIIYKHDGNGKCIEMASYDANEIMTKKTIHKYDGNGNEIEMAFYKAVEQGYMNILTGKYIYKYDGLGNMTEKAGYMGDGTLEWRIIYKYDEKNNRIEETTYDAVKPCGGIIFKYDSKGNMVEYEEYGASTSKHIFKYDSNGNRIEDAKYNKNGVLEEICTTSYTYY